MTSNTVNTEKYELGSLHLYREDLRAIANAVSSLGEISIVGYDTKTNSTFIGVSKFDLDQMPSELTGMEIEVANKYRHFQITFTATLDWARVEVSGAHPASAEAVSRIQEICKKRRFRLLSLAQTRWLSTIIFLLGAIAILQLAATLFAVFVGQMSKQEWSSYDSTSRTVVDLIVLGCSLGWLIAFLNPKVVITNTPRSERPTYWRRTREAWLIALATTLIGTLLGYVLSRWPP